VWALAHEDRLERVIGHLVQNSFDAMGAEGTVTLRTRMDGRYAVIEVEDSGSGMTPEFIRDELFKPFRSTKVTGMGVGAYESMQYVSELGGRMTVDSKVGTGTRICVFLPARTRQGEGVSASSITE
jgi:signal transduction histidine kinase